MAWMTQPVQEPSLPVELNLATIPRYEEYRGVPLMQAMDAQLRQARLQAFIDFNVKHLSFKCSDRARTCTFSPGNGVLRFLSHNKRKTHTLYAAPRRARKKTTWEVVGGKRT